MQKYVRVLWVDTLWELETIWAPIMNPDHDYNHVL